MHNSTTTFWLIHNLLLWSRLFCVKILYWDHEYCYNFTHESTVRIFYYCKSFWSHCPYWKMCILTCISTVRPYMYVLRWLKCTCTVVYQYRIVIFLYELYCIRMNILNCQNYCTCKLETYMWNSLYVMTYPYNISHTYLCNVWCISWIQNWLKPFWYTIHINIQQPLVYNEEYDWC